MSGFQCGSNTVVWLGLRFGGGRADEAVYFVNVVATE